VRTKKTFQEGSSWGRDLRFCLPSDGFRHSTKNNESGMCSLSSKAMVANQEVDREVERRAETKGLENL